MQAKQRHAGGPSAGQGPVGAQGPQGQQGQQQGPQTNQPPPSHLSTPPSSSSSSSVVTSPNAANNSPTAASQSVAGPGGHFLRSTAHQQQQVTSQTLQQQPPSPDSGDDSPPSSASHHGKRGASLQQQQQQLQQQQADDANNSADEFDDDTGPRNRRRESQNRASRNYRQRKKAYIKEMEAKLDALKLEVEVLRTENQKNRRMLSQYQGDKPAPLLRSYSSELQDEEGEIEKLVSQLNDRANSGNASEEDLRIVLAELHEHMSKRQQLLNKEAIQLINPKFQERFARLEATPQHTIDEQMGQWLDQVAQFVSTEQIQKLAELKQKHFAARASIWEERAQINADIKTFYQEKIAAERLNTNLGKLDPTHVSTLTHKLEALKKNLLREDELNSNSVQDFSSILTPYQEAIITVKHYSAYKDKMSAIQMLTNVWGVLSKQDSK